MCKQKRENVEKMEMYFNVYNEHIVINIHFEISKCSKFLQRSDSNNRGDTMYATNL
jgi:hypothetical protein